MARRTSGAAGIRKSWEEEEREARVRYSLRPPRCVSSTPRDLWWCVLHFNGCENVERMRRVSACIQRFRHVSSVSNVETESCVAGIETAAYAVPLPSPRRLGTTRCFNLLKTCSCRRRIPPRFLQHHSPRACHGAPRWRRCHSRRRRRL